MDSVLNTFYSAFTNLDGEKMADCYHDNVVFEDPAFGKLKGDRAKAMWQMLCESQKDKDFKVNALHINSNGQDGTAQWEAFYTFSKTGRKVHNIINAEFELKDGLIYKHTDHFNLRKWAKQAFGMKGLLLGQTRYFKLKLQAQTNAMLSNYIEKKEQLH